MVPRVVINQSPLRVSCQANTARDVSWLCLGVPQVGLYQTPALSNPVFIKAQFPAQDTEPDTVWRGLDDPGGRQIADRRGPPTSPQRCHILAVSLEVAAELALWDLHSPCPVLEVTFPNPFAQLPKINLNISWLRIMGLITL